MRFGCQLGLIFVSKIIPLGGFPGRPGAFCGRLGGVLGRLGDLLKRLGDLCATP